MSELTPIEADLRRELECAARTISALMDRVETANDRDGQQRVETAMATHSLVRRRTETLSRMNDGLIREAMHRRHLDRIIREMQRLSNLAGWELDPACGAMEVTEHFHRVFNLSSSTPPTLELMLACFTPSSATQLADEIDTAYRKREPLDGEFALRPEDGAERILRVVGSPLVEGGTVVRIYGVVKDITAQKIAQAQLAQAQRLESIGQLAAGIAHEINTPTQFVSDNVRFLRKQFDNLLLVIDTYASALARCNPDSTVADMIERTLKHCDFDFLRSEVPPALEQSLEGLGRISSIVRAMKEFSHPGSAAMEPADLNKAIASTVEVSRSRWKYVAEIELDLDSQLPLVHCLVAEVNQVILNLIVNAADAMTDRYGQGGEQKGLLRITSRRVQDSVEIRVQDSGGGIPEAVQPRLFEPFFTTKQVGRGTGQGLSICRSIVVKKHAGEIRFESTTGVGTVFIVRLPVKASRKPESAVAA